MPINLFRRISGSAVAMQDAMPRALKKGADIYLGDVLSTARASRLQIRMIDDAVIRLMQGAVRAVSGKIAQLDGHPFQLRTEVATIGVRGTEVWGGLLDGVHQFALLGAAAMTR